MKQGTESKAVSMLAGPRGHSVSGSPCAPLCLAPAAGNARYAIHGGHDLALVALTPPPPPQKS